MVGWLAKCPFSEEFFSEEFFSYYYSRKILSENWLLKKSLQRKKFRQKSFREASYHQKISLRRQSNLGPQRPRARTLPLCHHFELNVMMRPILSRKSVGSEKGLTDRRCSGWGTSWGPAGASSAWRTSWRLASRRSSRRSTGCCRPTPPSRGSRSSSRPTSFYPERLTQKVEVPLIVKQKPSSKI